MNTIKFCKNWNNKLLGTYFTTIRLYTPSKEEYYLSKIGSIFSVELQNKVIGRATLEKVVVTELQRLGNYLVSLDSGLTGEEFYVLMERFYSKKKEWSGYSTNVLVLLFKNK